MPKNYWIELLDSMNAFYESPYLLKWLTLFASAARISQIFVTKFLIKWFNTNISKKKEDIHFIKNNLI